MPVGVNRTWVKQVEKGTFPHTQRVFSVMRCNHCTDAPCVEICPVEALHIREDGIVDFDNERCIGCKACTQACPYDALYIDPQTHTAAKCNYCAHRIDVGLEPACVNVCPEHAIISGDMEDPESEISQLLAEQRVTVRKPEKGTRPNVFYIDGDEASLTPTANPQDDQYIWNTQSGGVGHFAKYAQERKAGVDILEMAATLAGDKGKAANGQGKKRIEAIMEQSRRVFDAPHKGTLWGWEVSGYVWTKAISTGVMLVYALGYWMGLIPDTPLTHMFTAGVGLVFLALTGLLLVKDLDQPKRFAYVLLRPQWKSWLVRGGYSITLYGLFLTVWGAAKLLEWSMLADIVFWGAWLFALTTAVYTAFLFAQAKGRDFWQSPMLSFHMLVHSFLAGAAAFGLLAFFSNMPESWTAFLGNALLIGLAVNALVVLFELTTPHPTQDAKLAVKLITRGRYKKTFIWGTLVAGLLLPSALLLTGQVWALPLAAVSVLAGIFLTEDIWIKAPQQIPLS